MHVGLKDTSRKNFPPDSEERVFADPTNCALKPTERRFEFFSWKLHLRQGGFSHPCDLLKHRIEGGVGIFSQKMVNIQVDLAGECGMQRHLAGRLLSSLVHPVLHRSPKHVLC